MPGDANALFGLKWNPFSPEIPTEACLKTPRHESFCWRLETLAREGGFALITGEPGTGKSVSLRLLEDHLHRIRDVEVGILTRPQCNVADFYRELGDIFGVELRPHNRWAGAKVLRQRWEEHIHSSLLRAVLVVDEAQEMQAAVLKELRLLCASQLDSRALLTIVFGGDGRLTERFREPDLLPLGSRIRVRLSLAVLSANQLREHLEHVLEKAGNPALMTEELKQTRCDHAAGNLRALMTMSGDLLDAGVQQEVRSLDEDLYFEVFRPPAKPPNQQRKKPRGRGR